MVGPCGALPGSMFEHVGASVDFRGVFVSGFLLGHPPPFRPKQNKQTTSSTTT